MLLKVALLLLFAWLLGVIGVYNMRILVNVLLLVGLMLLLSSPLSARWTVRLRPVGPEHD